MSKIAFCHLLLLCLCMMTQSSVNAQTRDPFGEDPFGGATGAPADAVEAPKPEVQVKAKSTEAKPDQDVAEWIRKKLLNRNTVKSANVPLVDLVSEIATKNEMPIIINIRALEEVGLTEDVPVTLSVEDISLRSFLRLALSPFDLTYAVQNEVLMITTLEHAQQLLTVQTFRLPESLATDRSELIKAIQTCVSPDQWEELGGACTMVSIQNTLVVSATEYVHEGVKDFLVKVDQALQGPSE